MRSKKNMIKRLVSLLLCSAKEAKRAAEASMRRHQRDDLEL